jgi:two-component system sporulation sensor kinase A
MSKLKGLSIKGKLILMMLAVSLVSVLGGVVFIVTHEIQLLRRQMVNDSTALARVIADYSVVDLAFSDRTSSERTLAKMGILQKVQAVYLYDRNGTAFSSYVRSPAYAKFPAIGAPGYRFRDHQLELFEPVSYQNQDYGTICILVSTRILDQHVQGLIIFSIILVFVLVLGSYFLAVGLQRVISRPILGLTAAARRVSDKEDYSIRVGNRNSNDEFGILCDGFNRMLEVIQRRQLERDRAEEALRESEERYRQLIEMSPEIILVEQDGRIVFSNAAGLRLLGYDALEDLNDKGMVDLFVNDRKAAAADYMAVRKARRAPVLETALATRDGGSMDVELIMAPTVFGGQPATRVVARDTTEIKRLRDAANRMERLAALGELSATIGHEIRNSLGSITLNFHTLKGLLHQPDRQAQILKNMELGIARIQNLTRGILDFARPAAPVPKYVDIHRVIDSSLRLIDREFQESGIAIVKNYCWGEANVFIDTDQIVQVFLNLFLNAKHAMNPGGTLTIHTGAQDGMVEVRVQDTGNGIAEENLQRIFNPFFTTNTDGIGLGLAIVSRILEQHRAEISVQSKPRAGACFTIRFQEAVRNTTGGGA